ncbi:hypothetical protein BDB01DRAFT_848579 [Pilobolus umbonatus]|nr:hypothetical protein BDB01DRAFT_848579 [Pilobolus umbonatus]
MDGILDRLSGKNSKPKSAIHKDKTRAYSVRRILRSKHKHHKQQSITAYRPSFEIGSAEQHFARQKSVPSANEVNSLFDYMLERRGIVDDKIKENMKHWSIEKKWLMIHQDHQAELLASGVSNNRLALDTIERVSNDQERSPVPTISRSSSYVKPQKSTSSPVHIITNTDQIIDSKKSLPLSSPIPTRSKSTKKDTVSNTCFNITTTDHNTPEYYIKKFLDPNLRSVTPKVAESLEISLRTRPIDWVLKFINLKGYHVVFYALDYLNHKYDYRSDIVLGLEVEIVKAIKAIVNTKVGRDETMRHPEYIHTLIFSILCPQWQTKKTVCELLVFLCYYDGYEHVIRGFQLLQKHKKDLALFDSWLKDLVSTIDNRYKYQDNISDGHLVEYALSAMILINTLTKIPSDVNYRIYMRNQLNASGMHTTVLPKLDRLNYDLLSIQIESYNEASENDLDEAFGEDISAYSQMSQPVTLFDRVIESISDAPRALEYYSSILKHLLWIRGDSDTKTQFYHMIDIIVEQIVMDRRPHDNTDEFASTFGMAVGTVIQNFHDLARLKRMESQMEATDAKIKKALEEKDELLKEIEELRILPSRVEYEEQRQRAVHYKEENDSLRNVLKTSKETIAMLQERLSERRYGQFIDECDTSERNSVDEQAKKKRENWLSAAELMSDSNVGRSYNFAFGGFFLPLFERWNLNKKRKKKFPNTRSLNSDRSTEKSSFSQSSPTLLTDTSQNADSPAMLKNLAITEKAEPSLPPPPPPPPPPPSTDSGSTSLTSPVNKGDTSTSTPSLNNNIPNDSTLYGQNVSSNITLGRKELHHYPQVKLKNLQWQKINVQSTDQTIWNTDNILDNIEETLNESGVFEIIEGMFPAKVNTFLGKKKESRNVSEQFLSKNKNKNINIAILSKLKHFASYKDVRQHILLMDDKLCTETFLINLITYLPGKEDDMIAMKRYLKSPENSWNKLDLPEQFTLEMMTIYRYESRLKFMLFRVQFWEKFEQLKRGIKIILSASDQLRDSASFKELLYIILLVGNYMNASSFQGGAFGVRISSINKLVDTKSSDSQLNLLHILINVVRNQFPNVLEFKKDLKDVVEAARIMKSISDINEQYTEMRQGLRALEKELESGWRNKEEKEKGDRFQIVMEEYLTSATDSFEELEALFMNVEAKWKDVMSYYGENPRYMKPEEFYGIFATFLQNWNKAEAEEIKYSQRKEREEKRRKETEERRELVRNLQESNLKSGVEDDRRLMDDLLEKLKNGEHENKLRKQRVRQRIKNLRNSPLTRTISNSSSNSNRRNSASSTSSTHIPAVSAEDLLRDLRQEDD